MCVFLFYISANGGLNNFLQTNIDFFFYHELCNKYCYMAIMWDLSRGSRAIIHSRVVCNILLLLYSSSVNSVDGISALLLLSVTLPL